MLESKATRFDPENLTNEELIGLHALEGGDYSNPYGIYGGFEWSDLDSELNHRCELGTLAWPY